MLLSLSILGIVLSVILLFFNARRYKSSFFLGAFFLLVSLYGFYQYILLYSKSVTLISLFLANSVILLPPLYLMGPMLYWYVRSVLTDNPRLKKKDFWHLLPAIIYFLAAVPYIFIPWPDKVEAAAQAVKDVGYMQTYSLTILEKVFSLSAIYLSRPLIVLGYTLWSIGLLIRYTVHRKVSKVFARQYFMTKWLCFLLGFLLVLVVTQILLIIRVFAMDFSELFFTLNVLRVVSIAGLVGLLFSPLFFPAILYGLPRFPEPAMASKSGDREAYALPGEAVKTASHLEKDYLISIGEKADQCMKQFQPFLQPHFNLAEFSVMIHIPTHHLAYYFREERRQSFIDYRNVWRINHAKNLIQEGKAKELTLEAIGLSCGFSSRNTFLTTFKKVEGITPSAFASQVKD
jgi:AraC-like DNA-binding protein